MYQRNIRKKYTEKKLKLAFLKPNIKFIGNRPCRPVNSQQ